MQQPMIFHPPALSSAYLSIKKRNQINLAIEKHNDEAIACQDPIHGTLTLRAYYNYTDEEVANLAANQALCSEVGPMPRLLTLRIEQYRIEKECGMKIKTDEANEPEIKIHPVDIETHRLSMSAESTALLEIGRRLDLVKSEIMDGGTPNLEGDVPHSSPRLTMVTNQDDHAEGLEPDWMLLPTTSGNAEHTANNQQEDGGDDDAEEMVRTFIWFHLDWFHSTPKQDTEDSLNYDSTPVAHPMSSTSQEIARHPRGSHLKRALSPSSIETAGDKARGTVLEGYVSGVHARLELPVLRPGDEYKLSRREYARRKDGWDTVHAEELSINMLRPVRPLKVPSYFSHRHVPLTIEQEMVTMPKMDQPLQISLNRR